MRNLKLIFSAAVALSAILGSAASAADLAAAPRTYTKAPVVVPPVYNWTGFYLGVNGGYGWGQTNWLFLPATTTANHSTSGGLAGGQIGYNWQAANWVFGLEADGDWANIKGSTLCPNPFFTCSSNTRDLASFRGRVGYAAGPVLFYGTGGLGYANSAYNALPPGVAPFVFTGNYNTDRWGYAAGAGIEYGFTPNWSAKLEYMHYGFGTVTAPMGTLSAANVTNLRLDIDTVKVGINYRFNWSSPVVAKY
jgi:outer membrane immunogenic protein